MVSREGRLNCIPFFKYIFTPLSIFPIFYFDETIGQNPI